MSSPTQSRINAVAATIVNMPAGLPAEYTGLSKADALALALSRSRFAIITPPEIQLVEYYYEGYNEPHPNVTVRRRETRPRPEIPLPPQGPPPGLNNSNANQNKRIRITLTLEIPAENVVNVIDRPPTPPAPRTNTRRNRGIPYRRAYHADALYGNGLYGWQMMGIPSETYDFDAIQSEPGITLCDFDTLQGDN